MKSIMMTMNILKMYMKWVNDTEKTLTSMVNMTNEERKNIIVI